MLTAAPRMLYQFLGNKAEKGPSITTEIKVTLEQMYNGVLHASRGHQVTWEVGSCGKTS